MFIPYSQQSATGTYPEPDASSPNKRPIYLIYTLISYHLRPGLLSGLFPSGIPTKILYAFLVLSLRAMCPNHLIFLDLGRGLLDCDAV